MRDKNYTVTVKRWGGFCDGKLMMAQDYAGNPWRACIYKTKADALREMEDVRRVTITWEAKP